MRLLPNSAILAAALALLSPTSANASLSTELQALTDDVSDMSADLDTIIPGSLGACGSLGTLNVSVEQAIASADAMVAGLASPLTLTSADLTSLGDLSNALKALAVKARSLSSSFSSIEDLQDLVEYRASLSAMLRLADDIGTMANRVLEMSDRILVMADNIGSMADRILITQQLQSSNVALTQAALLTTQQNVIALFKSTSTIAWNLTLGQLVTETQALSATVGLPLEQGTMGAQLAALEAGTATLLTHTVALYTVAMLESQEASSFVDGDTLTMLGNLSGLHEALASSLEAYASAIESFAPVTDNAVLRDATASMLQLTSDLGVMSGRIMEMVDRIVVMADNVGVMAGRITATQSLQQQNALLTQQSLLEAQSSTLALMQSYGL